MNTCKIDNPLTSFTTQGLVKEDNFLASSLAGLLVFLWVMVCPMGVWGQTNWIDEADINWYNDSESSFEITTPEQLAGLAQLVNGGNTFEGKTITLANDIVLNKGVLKENGELNGDGSNFKQWTSIGEGYQIIGEDLFFFQFKGTFDGNGHTVSGIYINKENADNQGLFGEVGDGGVITNVRVEDSYLDVDYSVGGIVGENYGTVSNCSNSGTVIGVANHVSVGGIVGNNGGTVSNCSNSGAVTGTADYIYVGGIAGAGSGRVTNCSNSAVVSGTGNGAIYVGGIAGGDGSGMVTNCSNSGKVVRGGTATYVYVGGIVGASGTVSNCYYLEGTCETGLGSGSGDNVTEKTPEEYESGEVANLLNQVSGEVIWGQDFDKGYPVPLGSLSEEEQKACRIYSVTFIYTLPGEGEEKKTITLYGNSDTPLAAPEETAVKGYAVTWTPELPVTFGTENPTFTATFTQLYTLTITQPTEGGTISATVGETPVEEGKGEVRDCHPRSHSSRGLQVRRMGHKEK